MYGWIARGWRRKEGEIENLELWKQAKDAVHGHQVMWRWVRGHKGHVQNEYANFLAVRAARDQSSSVGAVTSGFDAWLEAERAKGRFTGEPEEFPQSHAFKASRPFPNGGATSLVF